MSVIEFIQREGHRKVLHRVYQIEQFQCPHCGGIVRAPAEPIEGPSLAISPVVVKHLCPKLEKTIPVRFTITGLSEVQVSERKKSSDAVRVTTADLKDLHP